MCWRTTFADDDFLPQLQAFVGEVLVGIAGEFFSSILAFILDFLSPFLPVLALYAEDI